MSNSDEQQLQSSTGDSVETPKSRTKHMLTKVRISNFKRIREAELDIGPVTYIVGGNNSGKSSAIQAIHTAVTAAQVGRSRQQQVVPTSSLRYSPAASFERIGHGKALENKADGLRAIVEFTASADMYGEESKYRVRIYRGRNYDSIGVDREPKQGRLADRIQDPRQLFSIYTPGLSGIPLREEYMSYASVFQRAAGGEANLVFRNILRLIDKGEKLSELEAAVSELIGDRIRFKIKADETRDFHIEVHATIGECGSNDIPVELWGTGLLQVTQLYSYVILFEPSVFLVDEPDAHLHPSRQKLLASAFEDISQSYECQIIATTHSEHLIGARPKNTKLVWMRDGESETYENPDLIPLLMHLGCLDSISPNRDEVILLTEDEDSSLLQTAVKGLTSEKCGIKIISVNGVGNLGVANVFTKLKQEMPREKRIIIHRDRDFLVDEEIEGWLSSTFPGGVECLEVFVTRYCDIESYFCSLDYITQLYQDDFPGIATQYSVILREFESEARKEFKKKRKANNQAGFLSEGGSPTNDSLWPASEPVSLPTVVGKRFLRRLKEQLQKRGVDIQRIGTVAPKELLDDLRSLLSQRPSTPCDTEA